MSGTPLSTRSTHFLGRTIQDVINGVAENKKETFFSSSSSIYWLEEGEVGDGRINDKQLQEKLSSAKDERCRRVTIFVPSGWFSGRGKGGREIPLTQDNFRLLAETIRLPVLFINALFDPRYNVHTCGQGLFTNKSQGSTAEIELFYRHYRNNENTGSYRGYVFTRFNIITGSYWHVYFRASAEMARQWRNVLRNEVAQTLLVNPLYFHIFLMNHTLEALDDLSAHTRAEFLRYETGFGWLSNDQREAVKSLHITAKLMHMHIEDFGDLESHIMFLLKASKVVSDAIQTDSEFLERSEHVHGQMKCLLERCLFSKRWAANYKDRINILINLSFNTSTQTMAIDTARDSVSMRAIAVVTLLFLPGTSIASIYGMAFFIVDFNGGVESYRVSSKWWHYIAITFPLTIAVLVAWHVWEKYQVNNRPGLRSGKVDN